jgi:hypothetical protein
MLSAKEKKEIIEITKKWIETFIIDLGLCPFAREPYFKNKVRITISEDENFKSQENKLFQELDLLLNNSLIETTLLVFPHLQEDLGVFKKSEFLYERFIQVNKLGYLFQIVSFHPKMHYQDLPKNAPQQVLGQAPYPMIHILRVASVEKLGAQIKKDVQESNNQKLSALSQDDIKKLWEKVFQ